MSHQTSSNLEVGSNTHAVSFRDPDGRVFFHDKHVFRVLTATGESALRSLLSTPGAKRLLAAGDIVGTHILEAAEMARLTSDPAVAQSVGSDGWTAIAEHEAAPFANYAHEWAPEMLHAAGELTIRLALELLPDGFGLKDATPMNVMFWGPKPVFLDVLSFEQRDAHDPTWLPYAQFVRTFLLPLFANRRFGLPLAQTFLSRRDGLEPEEIYPLLSGFDRVRPSVLPLVSLPVWFGKRTGDDAKLYQPRRLKNAEQAQYILKSLIGRQQRALRRIRPKTDVKSTWSDYTEAGNNNYSENEATAKAEAVRRLLAEIRPADVLDVGCNTGVFSLLAADAGARVVSIDYDPVVIGRLWKVAQQKNASILPLVVNLARPTPALGWANGESRSFLDRATGAFDAVMMLAVLHHLIVTERVPLPEIFQTVRRMTRRWLIIEYVAPTDSMFRRLTRGRDHLHQDLNQGVFEAVAQRYFRIVRSEQIRGADRRLYLLEV